MSTLAIVLITVVVTLLLSIGITAFTIFVIIKIYIKYRSPSIVVEVTAPVGNDDAEVERLENPLYPHTEAGTGSSNTAVYDYVMNVHAQKNPKDVNMQKNPSYHTARFT